MLQPTIYLSVSIASTSMQFAVVCKALRGRNIVVSSKAQEAFQQRGPQDVINFATLMGMSRGDAKVRLERLHPIV